MKPKNQKEKPADTISFSKMMPQAIELEEAILGALLLETNALRRIENILGVNDFYENKHQIIFQAITNLRAENRAVDMLTVVQELQKMDKLEEIGGPVYIAELTERVASSAHIEQHANYVKEKALSRQLIETTSKIQQLAFDPSVDVADVLEEFEKAATQISRQDTSIQSLSFSEALKLAIDEASKKQDQVSKGTSSMIPTHLNALTKALNGGWNEPDLIILGARPSMGKTQHALAIAKHAALAGYPCGFFSIEMNATQLTNRILLEDDKIDTRNLLSGYMSDAEWNALDKQVGRYNKLPLYIADNYNVRFLNNIKSEARRLYRDKGIKLLIIDYLGLIKTNLRFERRQLEIAYITSELKALCKELKIPIILLSQLNRPDKGIKPRVPRLEDLRESGDIEQDADIVLFIHSPAYYDPDEYKDWVDKGMIIIAKFRNGQRNNIVPYEHDSRYKKIWDTQDIPSISDLPF